jgi:hypothetical protein
MFPIGKYAFQKKWLPAELLMAIVRKKVANVSIKVSMAA